MPPLPRRLTLVRHAMPAVDAEVDPAEWILDQQGADAAAALDLPPDAAAVSSPEQKSRQTVAIARGTTIDAVPVDDRFREIDRVERVHDGFRDARRAWVAGALDGRHEGWEHPHAAAQRFHEGLLAHPAEHLVVGTHGMVLTAWSVSSGLIGPGEDAATFWEALRLPDVLTIELPLLRVRAALTDPEGRIARVRRRGAGPRR